MEHGPAKRFVNAIEPLVWGPFVTGNVLTPLVFPAIVLMLGIAAPLGWLPADALSYERAHALATSPITVIGILVVMPLALLAGSHHLRFGIIDLASAEHDGPVALILYGLWQLGAIATAIALVRIFAG
jgi:fumarate reductase subunit D